MTADPCLHCPVNYYYFPSEAHKDSSGVKALPVWGHCTKHLLRNECMRWDNGWEEERGCKGQSSSLEPEARALSSSCISALTSRNWLRKDFLQPSFFPMFGLPYPLAGQKIIVFFTSYLCCSSLQSQSQTSSRVLGTASACTKLISCTANKWQCRYRWTTLSAAGWGGVSAGTCWCTFSWHCMTWESSEDSTVAATRCFLTPPNPHGGKAGKKAKWMQLENWQQVLYGLGIGLTHTQKTQTKSL